MLKLMIVDDEIGIQEHIRNVIDWNRLGMVLVNESGDGDSAMENYYLLHPQVVIMDICLPGSNGLTLAKEMIAQDPSVKIIVISSYQDFSYAKTAIALGVFDYLGKPIIPQELNNCLERIKEEYDAKLEESKRTYAVNQIVEQSKGLLQQWQVESMLEDEDKYTEGQLRQQMSLLGLDIRGSCCSVIMIAIQNSGKYSLDDSFASATVRQYTESKLRESGYWIYSYFDKEKVLCCLISGAEQIMNDSLETLCFTLRDEYRIYFKQNAMIGIGNTYNSILDVSRSAKQARAALQNARVIADVPVISYYNIRDLQMIQNHQLPFSMQEWISSVVECIREGREGDLDKVIHDQCDQLDSETEWRTFGIEFLGELSKLCSNIGIYPWKTLDYPLFVRQIFGCEDKSGFSEIITTLCRDLISTLQQKNSDLNHHLIAKAKEYIEKNYSDSDLSLEKIGEYVGISRSYFCSLFSRIEGKTYKAYLMDLRIRHAKRLLNFTDKKIYEISCEVGCSDSAYFNRMFKRVTGMTPLQYRNEKGREEP